MDRNIPARYRSAAEMYMVRRRRSWGGAGIMGAWGQGRAPICGESARWGSVRVESRWPRVRTRDVRAVDGRRLFAARARLHAPSLTSARCSQAASTGFTSSDDHVLAMKPRLRAHAARFPLTATPPLDLARPSCRGFWCSSSAFESPLCGASALPRLSSTPMAHFSSAPPVCAPPSPSSASPASLSRIQAPHSIAHSSRD